MFLDSTYNGEVRIENPILITRTSQKLLNFKLSQFSRQILAGNVQLKTIGKNIACFNF